MKPFRIEINDLMMERACENAKKIGVLKDSIRNGKGNIIGCLVEEMYLLALPDSERSNTYGRDFLYKGKSCEAKGKHQTVSYDPLGEYEGSVTEVSVPHQHPDFFVFGRVYQTKDGTYPYGWLLGGISYRDFFTVSRKIVKGNMDGNNAYIVKATCYNIRYDQLKDIKLLIDTERYKSKETKEIIKIS